MGCGCIKNPVIDVKPDRIHFKAKGEKEQNDYEFEIEFYKEVDVEVNHGSEGPDTPRSANMALTHFVAIRNPKRI